MKILGVETSCDDTGLAIYDTVSHTMHSLRFSQIVHAKYGGVIPEYASRDHSRKCLSLLDELLKEAKITLDDIDKFAYTKGPGLLGALLVGATFAKTLAFSANKPCIPVNHLAAHILIALFDNKELSFPFMGLLISGGHTLLIHAIDSNTLNIVGTTKDDAVGECFDKSAKLMGFAYPGGPKLSALAKQGSNTIAMPKPMLNKGLDFSFSGLKTHVKNIILANEFNNADIACSLETTIAEVLLAKAQKAMQTYNVDKLVVAGGVAANRVIRQTLSSKIDKVYFPVVEHCTDNGAMIAFAGALTDIVDESLDIGVFPKQVAHKLTA